MYFKIQIGFAFLALTVLTFILVVALQEDPLPLKAESLKEHLEPINNELESAHREISDVGDAIHEMHASVEQSKKHLTGTQIALENVIAYANEEREHSESQREEIERLVSESLKQNQQTRDTIDLLLSKMLGDPVGQTFGQRSTVKVFSLKESGYKGYMAKVKLHDPSAVKLVLSNGKVGSVGETTSQVGKRSKAILAINGGGFARQNGKLYPMGITVVNGEIKTFYQTDLSFIGFNEKGQLVGGDVTSKKQIRDLNVRNGATFVPTLLKDGKKQTIPSKWRNKREPRTLIGHFTNGDLLFIVIDGRQEGHSKGVTLEEAQDKLLEFKIKDAYTLDGGGSSTFYYNGKLMNRPSDGRERRLPTHFVVMP